mmetsp:Transcript_27926/g.82823  ORF Transcript_27926/g.82823 Transcript_27926/m.82823 type:complete len:95 (+) Transcript_27926:167-451(+)
MLSSRRVAARGSVQPTVNSQRLGSLHHIEHATPPPTSVGPLWWVYLLCIRTTKHMMQAPDGAYAASTILSYASPQLLPVVVLLLLLLLFVLPRL